jgi:hypothetical protein
VWLLCLDWKDKKIEKHKRQMGGREGDGKKEGTREKEAVDSQRAKDEALPVPFSERWRT